MTSTPAHRCSCRVAVRRNRASWMLAAFACVLLQTMLPCHIGPAVASTSAVDVQRLIDAAMCASGQLRFADDAGKPAGDGTGGSSAALASGCLHCVGLRDDVAAAPAAASWLALVTTAPPASGSALAEPDDGVAWAATWPRGPPTGARTSA